MLKTVKVKKQMHLDELIKYIFDNGIEDKTYGVTVFNNTSEVRVSGAGNINMSGFNNKYTKYTVEVEEPITEDTVFEDITVVFKINSRDETGHFYNSTLKDIKKAKNLLSAYIPINGKLELIWESGSDEL